MAPIFFKDFSLYCWFLSKLIMIWFDLVFFISWVHWAAWVNSFHQLWKFFINYFLENLSLPFPLFPCLWGFLICILSWQELSHSSMVPCSFILIILYQCVTFWIVSMSSESLIFSSFYLLLIHAVCFSYQKFFLITSSLRYFF